jgi:hypothetical protein
VKFHITYGLVDQDLSDTYIFNTVASTQQSGNTGQLILQCVVPTRQTDSDTWFISFIGNGSAVNPLFPATGFATIDDMINWISSNWSTYGTWYYSGNKLVLYLKSGIFSTASLDCYINTQYILKAAIPDLEEEEFYLVNFLPGNVDADPEFPDGIITPGDLLNWIQTNWNGYGTWTIVNNQLVLTSTTKISGLLSITAATSEGGFSLGFSDGFNV